MKKFIIVGNPDRLEQMLESANTEQLVSIVAAIVPRTFITVVSKALAKKYSNIPPVTPDMEKLMSKADKTIEVVSTFIVEHYLVPNAIVPNGGEKSAIMVKKFMTKAARYFVTTSKVPSDAVLQRIYKAVLASSQGISPENN